jgi:hypothetical protein
MQLPQANVSDLLPKDGASLMRVFKDPVGDLARDGPFWTWAVTLDGGERRGARKEKYAICLVLMICAAKHNRF